MDFFFKAVAIERARLVFPTPGGPTRQIIGLRRLLVFCFTAKYSIILSFTFSNPKCVEFRLASTFLKSFSSFVNLFQGIFNSQSR